MEHLHSQQIIHRSRELVGPDEIHRTRRGPAVAGKKHGITADALVEKVLALLKKKPPQSPHRVVARMIGTSIVDLTMAAIEARDLTKDLPQPTARKATPGAIKGLVRRRYDETRAADAVCVSN